MAVVIFGAIIVASLALALLASRGRDVLDIEEYIVGGRSFSGFLLFFLAVGEIYSIGTMVGLPGGIYAKGASYGIWFLGYILLAYPVGYFLAPLIWRAGKRYGALTFPDVLKSHYSSRMLEVVAALTTFAFLIPWAELQFTGLQVALAALGFDISRTLATVVAAIIAGAYIIVSGVRAPAFISILKDILLFGAIVVIGIVVASAAGGVANVFDAVERLKPSSLTVGGGESLTFTLTTIVFQAFGFMMTTTAYIFTGRSESTVKRTYMVMPVHAHVSISRFGRVLCREYGAEPEATQYRALLRRGTVAASLVDRPRSGGGRPFGFAHPRHTELTAWLHALAEHHAGSARDLSAEVDADNAGSLPGRHGNTHYTGSHADAEPHLRRVLLHHPVARGVVRGPLRKAVQRRGPHRRSNRRKYSGSIVIFPASKHSRYQHRAYSVADQLPGNLRRERGAKERVFTHAGGHVQRSGTAESRGERLVTDTSQLVV